MCVPPLGETRQTTEPGAVINSGGGDCPGATSLYGLGWLERRPSRLRGPGNAISGFIQERAVPELMD